MGLWRMRAEIDDEPGRLAALAGALADQGANVFGISVHADPDGPVDEFFVQTPDEIGRYRLIEVVTAAGGRRVTVLPAYAHDLVDGPTTVLALAARLIDHPETLPRALAELLRADDGEWDTADGAWAGAEAEHAAVGAPQLISGELVGEETLLPAVRSNTVAARDDGGGQTSLIVPTPDGRRVVLRRYGLPFTLTEVARARALVELLARARRAG